jgi:hypothetical protein
MRPVIFHISKTFLASFILMYSKIYPIINYKTDFFALIENPSLSSLQILVTQSYWGQGFVKHCFGEATQVWSLAQSEAAQGSSSTGSSIGSSLMQAYCGHGDLKHCLGSGLQTCPSEQGLGSQGFGIFFPLLVIIN